MIWAWPIFFNEIAQNGVRREAVPSLPRGARRTLCAFKHRLPCYRGSVTAVAFAFLFGTPLVGGSVMGRVELKDSPIASVRKGRDYSGVVLWLLPADGAAASRGNIKNDAKKVGKHARLIQKDKTFTPHVLAIEIG